MGASSDFIKLATENTAAALQGRDPHAVPPLEYLTRMVDAAITQATTGDPDDGSGWFAEMVNDPETGAPWVDGDPRWLEANPYCRQYWIDAGEEAGNRESFPEVDDEDYSGVDTPEARAFDTTTAVGQLELAAEVYDYVAWWLKEEDEEDCD